LDAYRKVFSDFVNNIEITTERIDIDSGGTSVRCTKINFLVTEDTLILLLNDLYEALENDDSIREYFGMLDNEFMQEMYNTGFDSMYREMMRELRTFVRSFERSFSGDITISFFVGRGNRLLRAEVNTDFRYDGERAGLRATFDFGSSVTDRWVSNITVTDSHGRNSARIVWNYNERSSGIENSITITADGEDPITLTSVWSPNRGDFTLSYDDGWSDGEITGVFTYDNDGFRLEFDDLSQNHNESLTIGIIVQYSAQIRQIEYINLDRWGETLINKLEEFFYDFMW
jgi:hypothetical protein